ncbi:OadG family protein [Paenibacillus paeoniae]|uniref:Uncharacterized protein n=1 Tax=Paenibacillus paeoniae TaxID=2292705 RepID=A0A371PKP4_9BACL|nr:OadG family protein [Paenibacillus paeoniae]REK76327.1 hypothetical protein DX130_04580 [Paenibacillus paeoniae]
MPLLFVLLGLIFLMIIISAYRRNKQNPSKPNQQAANSAEPIIPGGDGAGHGKSKGGTSESGSSNHGGDSGGDGGGGGD